MIARPIATAIARAMTGAGVPRSPPPVALPGIGSTTQFQSQRYMSTLPSNQFSPPVYGWELYGEEP